MYAKKKYMLSSSILITGVNCSEFILVLRAFFRHSV